MSPSWLTAPWLASSGVTKLLAPPEASAQAAVHSRPVHSAAASSSDKDFFARFIRGLPFCFDI